MKAKNKKITKIVAGIIGLLSIILTLFFAATCDKQIDIGKVNFGNTSGSGGSLGSGGSSGGGGGSSGGGSSGGGSGTTPPDGGFVCDNCLATFVEE